MKTKALLKNIIKDERYAPSKIPADATQEVKNFLKSRNKDEKSHLAKAKRIERKLR